MSAATISPVRATLATLAQAGIYITVLANPEESSEAYTQLSECLSKKKITNLLEEAQSNVWLWCQITVRADFISADECEYSAEEYLGGCSYKSRADFMDTRPGYFEDMLTTVVDNLNKQLATR